MTTLYTWASNTQKLRRIIDNMPQADEATLREEYIKQGGLLHEETSVVFYEDKPFSEDVIQEIKTFSQKESKAKKVKEAVKKIVKKVTKK